MYLEKPKYLSLELRLNQNRVLQVFMLFFLCIAITDSVDEQESNNLIFQDFIRLYRLYSGASTREQKAAAIAE